MAKSGSSAAAHPLRGIVLMVLAFGFITANDAAMKWVLAGIPVVQAIFNRGLVSLLVLGLIAIAMRRRWGLNWARPGMQILCGLMFTVSLFCFVMSLNYLPLAVGVVIISSGPIFVTMLAPFLLGEKVGWPRRIAVMLGFAGTVVVMQPGTDSFSWAMLLPFAGACLNAVREITVRRVIGEVSSISMSLTATQYERVIFTIHD